MSRPLGATLARAVAAAIILLAVQAVALVVVAVAVVQDDAPEPRPVYEYDVDCTLDHLIDDALLVRGLEGWQIASARRATAGGGLACYEVIWTREA